MQQISFSNRVLAFSWMTSSKKEKITRFNHCMSLWLLSLWIMHWDCRDGFWRNPVIIDCSYDSMCLSFNCIQRKELERTKGQTIFGQTIFGQTMPNRVIRTRKSPEIIDWAELYSHLLRAALDLEYIVPLFFVKLMTIMQKNHLIKRN